MQICVWGVCAYVSLHVCMCIHVHVFVWYVFCSACDSASSVLHVNQCRSYLYFVVVCTCSWCMYALPFSMQLFILRSTPGLFALMQASAVSEALVRLRAVARATCNDTQSFICGRPPCWGTLPFPRCWTPWHSHSLRKILATLHTRTGWRFVCAHPRGAFG